MIRRRNTSRSSLSLRTPWRQIVKRHSKWGVTGTSLSRASPVQSLPRFSVSLAATMATEARTSNEKKKLLVVDDHEDNVEVLRARLEARGYEVQGANDGQAALDMLERWIPDLILLDVMMPKVDGLEVVRRVKANDKLPFIPVIMQTALDSTERMVAGFEAG